MLVKFSNLNSNFALTLGYLNPALNNSALLNMSEQVGSVTRKKSSDFHCGIQFQSSFTIRWELEDKNFLKIDIICLDDSLKYRIMAIKTNENFIPFSNSVTLRNPREGRTW